MAKLHNTCACGSGIDFESCCGRYISGMQQAPTAEKLMRSRYSAYVLGDEKYLLDTWHHSTRPGALALQQDTSLKWIGLDIMVTANGLENDTEGTVEFVARYKINGKAERLHEVSRFCKEQGKWYYLDGDLKT
ncbi:MAG: YchJ family metal-binding protein [Gammaproteobacteria bacterium]